jgi:signal transduction histidine kinase
LPMPTRQNLELGKIRPLRLFVIILILLFTLEIIVMLVLPYLTPAKSAIAFGALIDACLLTGVLAPLLWYLIIKPLQKLAATRQRLLALTLSAQENERGRIARDLHDSLGQALTSLMIGLRTIEESSTEQHVKLQARELRRIGNDTHEEVRRLSRGLRPAVLDDLGLVPALERYAEDLCSSHQISATFERDCPESVNLTERVQIAVYRIVQEAATNAIRHGKAKSLRIQLGCNSQRLRLEIVDDGLGFDVASALKSDQVNSSFGLLSIHERAGLLGGEASISSRPGQGTQVRVHIPLEPAETNDG